MRMELGEVESMVGVEVEVGVEDRSRVWVERG